MICKFCSKECHNQNSLKNHERLCKNNPERTVKEKTDKWYEAMHKRKGCGTNQYIKAKKLGLPNPIVSEETRKKLSLTNKGKKHSKESREHLSEVQSKLLEEKGNGGFLDVKYYDLKNINNEDFKVRGTWELKYGIYLNNKNILWKRKVYLKYENEGILKTYSPDFYLPETNEYIEIKGFFSDYDKEKMKLVDEYNNIKVIVLQKKDLENIGIKF